MRATTTGCPVREILYLETSTDKVGQRRRCGISRDHIPNKAGRHLVET